MLNISLLNSGCIELFLFVVAIQSYLLIEKDSNNLWETLLSSLNPILAKIDTFTPEKASVIVKPESPIGKVSSYGFTQVGN